MSSSPETPNWLSGEDAPAIFEFSVNGEPCFVSQHNSIIRRFTQGDGRFDYLVYSTHEGHLVFMPDDEEGPDLFDDLERRGFKVEFQQELDEAAMKVIVDMELSGITYPAN